MQVRPATAADRPAVWALNAIPNIGATGDDDWPLDLAPVDSPPPAFPDLATIPGSFADAGGAFLLVTDDDGRIVGMGGFRPTGPGRAEVLRVRVHPARRRRGVGTLLMRALEAAAAEAGRRELHLDTATNQPEAVAFYEALGYERTATETHPTWTWPSPTTGWCSTRDPSASARGRIGNVQFSPDLRDRVADGTITVSYRLWSRPKVKVGGVYRSGSVTIEIDDVELLPFDSITDEDLARTGEPDRETLRRRAAHAGPIHDDTLLHRVEFHVRHDA